MSEKPGRQEETEQEETIYRPGSKVFELFEAINEKWKAQTDTGLPHVEIDDVIVEGKEMGLHGTTGSRYSESRVKARFLPVRHASNPDLREFIDTLVDFYGQPSDGRVGKPDASLSYRIGGGKGEARTIVLQYDYIGAADRDIKNAVGRWGGGDAVRRRG